MKIYPTCKTSLVTAAALLAVTLGQTNAQTVDPATDPKIDPPTRAFLMKLNAGSDKPIEQMTPEAARQVLAGAQRSVRVDLSGVEKTEKSIDVEGTPVKLTVVKPAGAKGDLPAFMFFHGGGWVLGDFPTHERFVRDLVVGSARWPSS